MPQPLPVSSLMITKFLDANKENDANKNLG